MSYRYECIAEVDEEGRPQLPEDIAARLRLKGIRRVRIQLTSMAAEEALLEARGIDAETIDRTAAVQKFDRDIAVTVLAAEGSIRNSDLAGRLAGMVGEMPEEG